MFGVDIHTYTENSPKSFPLGINNIQTLKPIPFLTPQLIIIVQMRLPIVQNRHTIPINNSRTIIQIQIPITILSFNIAKNNITFQSYCLTDRKFKLLTSFISIFDC